MLSFFGIARARDEPPIDVFPMGIAPFIRLAPVRQGAQGRMAEDGLFGLLPHFATELAFGRRTYNARSETVAQLPSFKHAWARAQRCVIPAEAIYEPNWESGKAVRWRIVCPATCRWASQQAAQAAVEAAFAIEGDGWDLPNGYFWAARACAATGWTAGTQRIRQALNALGPGIVGRNQALQAASAAGHRAFLAQRLAEYMDGARYPRGMIRDGNLALAGAAMAAEAAQVFDLVGTGHPKGRPTRTSAGPGR